MKIKLMTALLCSTLFVACNKEDETPTPTTPADTTAPVITMLGASKDTVVLNSTYSDPGFTANDNVDGNITANVVVSGALNMNQVGDYTRKYNVSDAAGNAAVEVTRKIHVRNEAWYLEGSYSANPNCGSTPSSVYNTNIAVSTTQNKVFSFSTLQSNYTGLTPTATLGASSQFTLTSLSGNGAGFSGSGQVLTNGNLILSSYIQQPGVIGGYFCTSTLTPQ